MVQPVIINGNSHRDDRGSLTFVNDFDMTQVKRFYTIFHPSTSIVRAWQGHQLESKWFLALDGIFHMVVVQPDDWHSPSPKLPLFEFVLEADKSRILFVPGGFATGFKALRPSSRMIVFSDMALRQSVNDDYRFDMNNWYNWDKMKE